MENPRICRAIISVSEKLGLADFAHGLNAAAIEIYSTGGTRRHLEVAGVPVKDISAYTEFPEMMDGRLKTLHPKVFGGILCRHDRSDDLASLETHGIKQFQLVVVNLYPFQATISRANTTYQDAVEQIDIGGPSLVRAAAKNSQFVTVATNPSQYAEILDEIETTGSTSLELRLKLMRSAFEHTADYDAAIANYLSRHFRTDEYPKKLRISGRKQRELRYGENSQQSAAVYTFESSNVANVISARKLNGKELSYNNLLDADSALNMIRMLPQPSVSVVKHTNPCGAASADALADACEKAMLGDPESAFGSIIATNRTLDKSTAEFLAHGEFFVEVIVAPDFEAAALNILTTIPKWKKNVRLLQIGQLEPVAPVQEYRSIVGGILVQQADNQLDPKPDWKVVTDLQPCDETMRELEFGWSMVRHVKSNAITLSKDLALCGVGAGQMSRVDSVRIAIRKAADRAKGSVLASDAFFPFADSIDLIAKAGVAAIIQPGGSVRDNEVIDACNRHDIPMIFTSRRHFRH
jgi:phosphoribosylaminoimidazolecarboxamide formyltransferase / IMP cyclohydrolase